MRVLVGVLTSLFVSSLAGAQLTDETQTSPAVPGGQIGKSLSEQIGTGHGDTVTEGSAVYLIARDPARSIRRGRQLFQRKFTAAQGLGPRVNSESTGDVLEARALGAGISDSCAGCHGRPRGAAGFGGDVATRPDSRDAPHLFGLGIVEQLADEITRDLRTARDEAVALAVRRGTPVRVQAVAKGISYGALTASPDGGVDTSELEGVDPDLRIKPFFHHGETASIREFVIGAFNAEMGMQASDPILCAATDPGASEVQVSPGGFVFDPSLDTFERPPGCEQSDPDADGVADEVDPAVVDHLEFYLLNYFKPGVGRVTAQTRRGRDLMKRIGCNSCHTPNHRIESDRRVADVDTVYDSRRGGMFNRLYASVEQRFAPFEDGHVDAVDGEAHPQLLPTGKSFVVRGIYSDLKRHDLGPLFHERDYDDVETGGESRITEFVTEPLWGVGSTSPYGHDGRSINLEEVIRRHGGEAKKSRKKFAKLRSRDREAILSFLRSLVLFPPDDTASDLNPGNPEGDPQDPADHGNIALPALYQLPYEGVE